jgi:hypothetical protein
MAVNQNTADPSLFGPMTEPMVSSPILFLTNRHNLLEILASGIIAPREAFEKYYDDLLALAPGRVPLLRGSVSREACEIVSGEDETAFPVALELDSSKLAASPVVSVVGHGTTSELASRQALAWAPTGVIPISAVTRLHFRSETERREHERRQYENVPTVSIPSKVSPGLFVLNAPGNASLRAWFGQIEAVTPMGAAEYTRVDRLAGASCMVAAAAPGRPEVFRALATLFTTSVADAPQPKKRGKKDKDKAATANVAALPDWIMSVWRGAGAQPTDLESRLFSAALKVFSGISRTSGWRPVEALAAIDAEVRTEKLNKAEDAEIARTTDHIRAILRNERDLKPFRPDSGLDVAKALLMVLLRPEPARLLAWPRADIGASEAVFVTAAALSGALTGYKRLPANLREGKLHSLLSERIALALSRSAEAPWPRSGFVTSALEVTEEEGQLVLRSDDGVVMARRVAPPTLAQLIAGLDRSKPEVAQRITDVCRALGWDDCVTTIITLDSAEFLVRAERKGSPITLRVAGWPEMSFQLNDQRFGERLAVEGIRADDKARVGAILGDALPAGSSQ